MHIDAYQTYFGIINPQIVPHLMNHFRGTQFRDNCLWGIGEWHMITHWCIRPFVAWDYWSHRFPVLWEGVPKYWSNLGKYSKTRQNKSPSKQQWRCNGTYTRGRNITWLHRQTRVNVIACHQYHRDSRMHRICINIGPNDLWLPVLKHLAPPLVPVQICFDVWK